MHIVMHLDWLVLMFVSFMVCVLTWRIVAEMESFMGGDDYPLALVVLPIFLLFIVTVIPFGLFWAFVPDWKKRVVQVLTSDE